MPSLHNTLLWSCLQVLTRPRFEALLEVYGTLDEAAKHVDETLLRNLGCREETVAKVMDRLGKFDAEKEEHLLHSVEARLTALTDDNYPERLRDLPDAPAFLYARGDLSIARRTGIAVVGTRRMSAYGKRVTQNFTSALAHAGLTTVSGLAKGVDACVAEETMATGMRTIAVLGHGLLATSPSTRRDLLERIVGSGGLVLSEFPMTFPADTFTFPQRNRIVAGLSLATLVTEAPEGSGALITAKMAFDYGRDAYAVPGPIFDPNYAGCHQLIASNKARLVGSPEELLRELNVLPPDPESRVTFEPRNDEERRVYDVLTSMPQSVDDLVELCGLPSGSIGSTLTILELQSIVKNLGQGQWIRN